MEKISVIMPVYNNEEYLHQSIQSVLNQTFSNFELIIVNDGSSDDSEAIVLEYLSIDERIKYFYQENQGVSVARNKGILEATGKYICFLDSDDLYQKEFLLSMVNKAEEEFSDLVYTGTLIQKNNKQKRLRTSFLKSNILSQFIKSNINTQIGGWVVNRDLLNKHNINFTPGLSWGEDIEFLYRCISVSKKISYVKDYLIIYRIDDNPNRLSSFSFKNIDIDYKLFLNLVKDDQIYHDTKVDSALIDYRLNASLTYRLWDAVKLNEKYELIKEYYDRYNEYYSIYTWNNGLRSIKLNITKFRLNRCIERHESSSQI